MAMLQQIVWSSVVVLLLIAQPVQAERPQLVVHDGGALYVTNGTVILNCGQLLVETGGVAELDGADIRRCGKRTYADGSLVTAAASQFDFCAKPWLWLIFPIASIGH